MKFQLLAAMAASLLISVPAWAQKVGFVDVQKAVQTTAAGKKAKAALDGEFKKRKDGLDKKKSDIEKMGQDLEKKKNLFCQKKFWVKNRWSFKKR